MWSCSNRPYGFNRDDQGFLTLSFLTALWLNRNRIFSKWKGFSVLSTTFNSLFPSLEILSDAPSYIRDHTYLFHDPSNNRWICIDKMEVSPRDYDLLSLVYNEVQPASAILSPEVEKWMRFLNGDGPPPLKDDSEIRAVHLSFARKDVAEVDVREAVEAFFGNGSILLFPSPQQAVLLEQKSEYIHSIDDYISFAAILESDFFIKLKMYIGKFHTADSMYPGQYKTEKQWFSRGISSLPGERIFTMERVFPTFLMDSLSGTMENVLRKEITEPINYDVDMLKTVRLFFENGFNASVTSDKLHIHRNTLNYRLAKFQDITGISVRNFDGALVAYCASLLAIE